MFIAIDGACKRNGQPTCSSIGVAWIQTNTELLYKSLFETASTSQRGEINGLISALKYAAENVSNEVIIILTDSEYLYNTMTLDWYKKWHDNNWIGATGPVKNQDKWQQVYEIMQTLGERNCEVYMEWTKGHIMSYTPGNTKSAMLADLSGIELYTRISTVAHRESEASRIIKDFNKERVAHEQHALPQDNALKAVIGNTTADCIASFLLGLLDETMV